MGKAANAPRIAENEAITFEDIKRVLPHANLITVQLDPDDDEELVF